MSHVRVTINGEKMMDDNLGNWTAQPPEFLKRMVQKDPHSGKPPRPESHIMAVGVAISTAVLTGEDANIDVTTDEDGWSMSVKRSFAIALSAG